MLGLTPLARELLDLLVEFRRVSVRDLARARDAEAVKGALAELRRNGLASVHLNARGRQVACVTDRGRRA